MPTNKFHYIWMGRLPVGEDLDAFIKGPNLLAKQLKDYVERMGSPSPQDQEIIMWVPEDLIQAIKTSRILDEGIIIKPIEDIYTNSRHLSLKERENLRTTVNLLGGYKAFSAQKDILQAAILAEYGGYYLDTTTIVRSIQRLIDKQPCDIWFPRVTDYSSKYYDEDQVILADVWAMYTPEPDNATCKAMLNCYVKRCQFYFPDRFEDKLNDLSLLSSRSGYTVWGEESYNTGDKIMNSDEHRDLLIGELVMLSLYDGLKQTKGDLTDSFMKGHSSLSCGTDYGRFLNDFGIEKHHRGMWRNQARADAIKVCAESREVQDEQLGISAEQNSVSSKLTRPFSLQGSGFANFKVKYQSLKEDNLKIQIISDFAKSLSEITDVEELNRFVLDFKKSRSYHILLASDFKKSIPMQHLSNWVLPRKPYSIMKVNDLILAKEKALEEKKLPNSPK